MIACRDLLEILNTSSTVGVELSELYGILLLALQGYGRVAISKELGVRERLVRKILEVAKREPRLLENLKRLTKTLVISDKIVCTPILYEGLSREIIGWVSGKVIYLRDYIVIYSKNPSKFEVIGILNGDMLEYPGLPEELSEPYKSFKHRLPKSIGLLVCWRNYRENVDDALLLAAITSLCVNHILVEQGKQ